MRCEILNSVIQPNRVQLSAKMTLTYRQKVYVRATICSKLFHNSAAHILQPELRNALTAESQSRNENNDPDLSVLTISRAQAHGNNCRHHYGRPHYWIPVNFTAIYLELAMSHVLYDATKNWADEIMNRSHHQSLSDYFDAPSTRTSGKRWEVDLFNNFATEHLIPFGWACICNAMDGNGRNSDVAVQCAHEMQSNGSIPREITILKYPAHVNAGIENHRDEYACYGSVILILEDCPGWGLQVRGVNIPSPLSPRDVVVVDPKSVHWVPFASRPQNRTVIVLVY